MKGLQNYLEPLPPSELVVFACTGSRLKATSLVTEDKSKDTIANFSAMSTPRRTNDQLGDAMHFSLVKYIQEVRRTPKDVIKIRVSNIVKYVNAKDKDEVLADRDIIIRYLSEYLYTSVFRFIQDVGAGDSTANLYLALGIKPYITDPKVVNELQRILKRVGAYLAKNGFLSKDLQTQVTDAYQAFFAHMLQTIETKMIDADKHGLLTSKPEEQK